MIHVVGASLSKPTVMYMYVRTYEYSDYVMCVCTYRSLAIFYVFVITKMATAICMEQVSNGKLSGGSPPLEGHTTHQ